MTATASDPTIAARRLVDACEVVVNAALRAGAAMTDGGRNIDDHQVHTERLAYLATQVRAAAELTAFVERTGDAFEGELALVYSGEVAWALRSQLDAAWDDFGLDAVEAAPLRDEETRAAMRRGLDEGAIRAIGRTVIAAQG